MFYVNVYNIKRKNVGYGPHDGWIDVGKFEETIGTFNGKSEAEDVRFDTIGAYNLGKGAGIECYYVFVEEHEGRDFPQ